MARTFEELIPDLLGARGLTEVPPEIAIFHLRKAAIALCERSHVWTQEVILDTQEGVSDYPIELEDGAKVVAIKSVAIEGCNMYLGERGTFNGCSCHGACGGNKFRVKGLDTLIVPKSHDDAEQAITVTVICKPGQDSCVFPEQLYEDWAEVIADGAAYRCCAMLKQPWTSVGMVTYYMRNFNAGVTRAKNQRVLQKTIGPLMMRGMRF